MYFGTISILKSYHNHTPKQHLKRMVEKKTSLLIKCLQTNRRDKFTSLEFNKFCEQNDIKRQLITTYTLQQNNVSERKNRTIMNMIRAMLFEKKIPKTLWVKAVN